VTFFHCSRSQRYRKTQKTISRSIRVMGS